MKKILLLFAIILLRNFTLQAATYTLNPTATGWATTSGNTTGNLSVTNAANRGYAVFNIGSLSLPAGTIITSVTLGFTVGAISGSGSPTCTIYGYTGDISTLSATSIYNACTTGTTSIYSTTWGTTTGARVMATTAAADTIVARNRTGYISTCFVLSASTYAYTINGTSTPVPVLTITTCDAPTAVSITMTPNPVCAGTSVTLSAAATGGSTYSWSGPSSFTSTTRTPSAFTSSTVAAGIYTFTATASCGATTTVTKRLYVGGSAPAAITAPTNLCGATGYTVAATNTVSGGTWTSSAPANAVVDPTTGIITSVSTGATTITYNTGCTPSVTASVTVRALPNVAVNNARASVCYGSASITASGANTYAWSPAAGLSATAGATVVASPTITTTYTVTGTTTSTGCTNTATSNMYYSAGAMPFQISAVSSPTLTCSGGSATLIPTINNSLYNTITSIPYAAQTTTGTSVLAGDDDNYITVTLPFTFNFYGQNYTSVNIVTNGYINFGTPTADYTNYAFPDASAAEGAVALFMHDMDLSAGGNIKYQTIGTTPNRKFVISYNAVADFGGGSTNTGQIILYETSNNIDLLIASCRGSVNSFYLTTGVQDLTASTAVTAPGRNGVIFDATSEAWRITGVANSGYLYSWTPAASMSSSTAMTPTAGPIAATSTFTVTISDSASGCYKATSASVTIGSLTGTISPNTSVCSGSSASVVFNGPGGGTATYRVNGGSPVTVGLNALGYDTVITPPISSRTIYSLESVASGVCTQTITGQVDTISTVSPPTVSVTPDTTSFCYGSAVSITAVGTGLTYSWAPATGLSATTGATITAAPSAATLYTVTAAIGACTTPLTVLVNVNAPINVAATSVPTVTCVGGASSLNSSISSSEYNSVVSIPYAAVSTAGTSILVASDDDALDVALPFTFFFYGNGYTSVSICTNGYINFGGSTTDPSSYSLPSIYAPSALIALFQQDLYLYSGTIKYQTLGTAPYRRFVVSYNAVPDLYGYGTNTGQIILYETYNYIDLLVANHSSTDPATCGIQNAAGTSGIAAPGRNSTAYTASNEAWRFAGIPTSGFAYSWAPAATLSSSTASAPSASGISASTVYTLTVTETATGCVDTAQTTVNVGTLPGTVAISGVDSICSSTSTNIIFTGPGNAIATYTLNGGAPTNITLDSTGTATLSTGVITANATYVLTTITSGSCVQSITGQTVTVRVRPAAGPITGVSSLCATSSFTFTNPVSGGVWSSSTPARATVNSSTGAVTGVTAGSATISYAVGTCPATTFAVTVTGATAAITPAAAVSICARTTTTLACSTTGGTWRSSNNTIATVDSVTGVVTGVAAGSVTISYSNGCGTPSTKTITINAAPSVITGATLGAPVIAAVCTLASTSFTDTISGGTWTNTPTTVGTINSSGLFRSGTAVGVTTISYTIGSCAATATVNVGNSSPTAITGASSVCATATTTLTDTTLYGVWSSSSTSIASIDASTGDVYGVDYGTATITYSNGCGIPATRSITVNGSVPTLAADTVCTGTSLHLTSAVATTGTYSWVGPNGFTSTSANPTISGVRSIAAGTYTLTFTSTTGSCVTNNVVFAVVDSAPNVTVTASPTTICSGSTSALTANVTSPVNYLMYAIPYSPLAVGSGTNGPSGDDASTRVTLPFTFNFYGTNYTAVRICTNGFLNFGALSTDYSTISIPSASAPLAMISLFWQDLTANVGEIKYTTLGTAPNRKFVVSFNNVYDLSGSSPNTGQVVLYETSNMVDIYVATANSGFSYAPLCGIQNATGSAAMFPSYENNTSYSVNSPGEAWRFVTPSYNYTWSPSGTLSAATGASVTSTGLTATQVYTVTARDIYSFCAGTASPVTVNVNPAPTAYSVTGGGSYCTVPGTGVHIGLSGSSTGTTYQLKKAGVNVGAPVAGTGSALDFGVFTDTAGIYTVLATITATGCTATMTGSTVLTRVNNPSSYTVSGGTGCASPGVTIGVTGSQTGTTYQLFRDGSSFGSAVSGTGSAVSFGLITSAGIYTVTATNAGGCSTAMSGSSTINNASAVYTITGGNGCSASGTTVGISGSDTGISYQLYRDGSAIGSSISGTGFALSFGTQTTTGIYSVRSTAGGCTVTMTGNDTVYSTPSISPGGNPNICQPLTTGTLSYTFATGFPNAYSVAWSASALSSGFVNVTGSSLGASIPLTVPSGITGSYSGSLTVTNGACNSSVYPVTVSVYAPAVASISATDVAPCSGHSVNILFTGNAGATFRYRVNGGALNTATFPGSGVDTLSTGPLYTATTYTLYDVSNPACSHTYDTTITINPANMQWVGGTLGAEHDWNTATNWSCGLVPSSTDSVFVPVTLYDPAIGASASGTAGYLRIDSAVTLTIGSAGTLSVAGDLQSNATIIGAGTTVISGSTTQHISGYSKVSNLEIANTAGAIIDSQSRVTVDKVLTVTSGSFTTNDSLVLGADTFTTARLAPMGTGTAIIGQTRVMQTIQGGYRRYRFWSHPFSNTIPFSQMQESIDLTGFRGAANGFVPTLTNTPSAYRYTTLRGNSTLSYDPGWLPITNALASAADTNKIARYQGIRVFMRGAKGEGLGYGPYYPHATVISQWGSLNQGRQVVTLTKGSSTGQDYNLLGNPYASPVDIGNVLYRAKVSGNIIGSFYVWNPTMGTGGQFQAYPISTVTPMPYFIQANSAFEVRAANNNDTLVFDESDKSSLSTTVLLRSLPEYSSFYLYDAAYHPWDVLQLKFDNHATPDQDKVDDADKLIGGDLNFYAFSADGKRQAIDVRPFEANGVIPLGITTTCAQDYILRAENLVLNDGQQLYLHDKLLGTNTLMRQGSEYRFTINKDNTTQGNDRFELKMSPSASTVDAKGLEVMLSPNPAENEVSIRYQQGKSNEVTIRLTNLTGVSLYLKNEGSKLNGVVNVPLQSLAAGIYLIEVTSGDHKVIKRLVKE